MRELAATKGVTLTEAIRAACDEALRNARRDMTKDERYARMRAIREELAGMPDTGVKTDKAFFDALNDE
ncbi:transcription factor [Methylopila turkensis]|uniref:Transcription factor n=1 Tax=Methylopila turkensis TaxID=1437816 RepID=A0A9W6N6P4_9HYPH|nr:transcription factor [Methylopila turkensis]